MLKVSIVTISFNQAAFLERAMLSVLGQDYSNIEYIVVDPGSTDGSRELIAKYVSRIARTILEPDNGAADGLNKGFAVATGEILGFLNSDDILYPGAVLAAVKFLASHSDVDVVSGHAKVIGPDDQVLRLVYSDRMSATKYIYGGGLLVQPSTFFRRSAFDCAGGFNVNNRATWDGELFLDMACNGSKMSLCEGIWSGYRLHAQSITSSKKMEQQANSHREDMFLRVVGRRRNCLDKGLQFAFRIWKHVTNVRDTKERILRGPVYGRSVS